jgi:archaellum component FlaF (FlaF/FlaG flagellin family)
MTFASNPPDDMRVMLQKRNPGGNNAEWIIVKLYYPFPNSIEVSVNGQVQKPISLLDNNGEGPLDTTKCGSNKFFYKNYTIHFVVTNSKDCLIRVRLTNAIQLTLRFAVDVNSFFSTNGPTRLVDRICAIFNITDQSRVKIVGVYTGSTAVSMIISTANNGSTTANVTDTQEVIALNEQAKALFDKGVITKETQAIGLPLIAMSSKLLPVRPLAEDAPENDDDMERKIIIGVSVSIAAVVLIVTAIIIYIKKTANNKVSEELPQNSSQASDKAKSNEKAVHETIEVQNITEENISEVIFEKTH